METEAQKKDGKLQVLYFLHAYSDWDRYTGQDRSRKANIECEHRFMDPSLCSEYSPNDIKNIIGSLSSKIDDVKLVFVSPMARCIETVDKVFRKAAGSSSIRIVVHPLLMPRFNHPGDLACRWRDIVSSSSLHFDISLMEELDDGFGWQLELILKSLPQKDTKISTLTKLRDLLTAEKSSYSAFKAFCSFRENHQEELESPEIVRVREKLFCLKVLKYASNFGLKNNQIVICCHSGFAGRWLSFTGEEVSQANQAIFS